MALIDKSKSKQKPEEPRLTTSIRIRKSYLNAMHHAALESGQTLGQWIESVAFAAIPPMFRKGLK